MPNVSRFAAYDRKKMTSLYRAYPTHAQGRDVLTLRRLFVPEQNNQIQKVIER